MSNAIHHAGKYWIAPFAPGFDARLVGGLSVVPRNDGQTLRTEYATAANSAPDVFGLISWNEFSENTYVEPSVHYGSFYLRLVSELRSTAVSSESGTPRYVAVPAANGSGVLRLVAFAIALVGVVALASYARRRAARRGHAASASARGSRY